MNKVFLFDVGGVIKYPFKIEDSYKILNVKESFDVFKPFFKRTCALAESGKITDEEFFNGFIKEFNLDMNLEQMIDNYNSIQGLYNEEALELLKQIRSKGYKVCILSNLKKIDYDNFVRDVSKDCYDKFYKSYEIGYNKPDKEIYEYVIKDIGIDPSDIIFFDDRMENVEGAKKLGIDARCVDVYHLVEYFNDNFNIE